MASRLLFSLSSSKNQGWHSLSYNSNLFSRKFNSSSALFSEQGVITPKKFDKILIANRGEIAVRVMKTARRMGIKTVAIHSTIDANAKHVEFADEAVCVGPPPTRTSYLNIPSIIDAIKKTGAQAVHPGYGFLSEKAEFAKALEDIGVAFIGPSSYSIGAMGDKIESKKIAKAAGVNTIPGELTEANDIEDVLKMARAIEYPVMIKASAGGGGKGMRIAWNDEEAREGYRLAKQEAMSSFGDDRILIEKFIDHPRHIEIQLIGDGQGNTLYLNERECSIQRRNQKVLEEAPSSFIDAATRKKMGEQAVALANAVKYKSAGTCEFLVDSKKNFYFLEMNTRLQVEHPVTEYITGLDLVELMIKVAQGEKLPLKQSDVQLKGWATEARVYSEDPYRNFLPSIGNLDKYIEPKSNDGSVRCDSGVREGDEISVHWDPMISKLIGYGKDRRDSIDKLSKALDNYVIRGVNPNVSFIRSVLENPKYLKGDISTNFIPEEYPGGFKGHNLSATQYEELISSAAVIHRARLVRDASLDTKLPSFEVPEVTKLIISVGDKDHKVSVEGIDGSYEVKVDGKVMEVSTRWPEDSAIFNAIFTGKDQEKGKERTLQLVKSSSIGNYIIQHAGTQFNVNVRTPKQFELSKYMPVKKSADNEKVLLSPMPGRLISVAVKKGDKVTLGQEICVVEAMKMQNVLRATRDCIVKEVKVAAGTDIVVDQVLVEFE